MFIMYNNYNIKCFNSLSKYIHKSDFYSNFIKRFHYKGTLARGCKYNYCLFINNKLAGIASYGVPNSKTYNNTKTIELKRFILSPNCKKNTASWFMSKCHKLLPKNYENVLSYSECDRHDGIIYKASNFKFIGQSKKGQAIMMRGHVHSLRAAYQKIGGKYTKLAKEVSINLRNGNAKYISTSKKNIFILRLNNK